jgi:hypothetical protein
MLLRYLKSRKPWKLPVETLNPQARVGCRTATYSTSSGTKSGSSSENS